MARWGIELDLKSFTEIMRKKKVPEFTEQIELKDKQLIFHMKLILTMYSKKRTFCRPEGAMRPFQKIYQESLAWFPFNQLDSLTWGFDSLI